MEVTEGAHRVGPSGPPWPPEWHCKASPRNQNSLATFDFHLFYICFAPCHSSCFVAIFGFGAQLGPELSLQKVACFFFFFFVLYPGKTIVFQLEKRLF